MIVVAPCHTCGGQPTMRLSEYRRGHIEIACDNCTDADFDGERYVQTNPVFEGQSVADAVEHWNQDIYERLPL